MKINKQLLNQVITLSEETGKFQLKHFRKLMFSGGSIKSGKEWVSKVDTGSEKRLKSGLNRIIPEAGFYGEESGRSGNNSLFWVVDPLDGTTNFLSGIDQFSISISLFSGTEPILGVVHKPYSGETFSGISNKGFWFNSKKMSSPGRTVLKKSLLSTGFPYRSPDTQDSFFHCARELLNKSSGIRRFGSAALDLSYVACGYFQGFWETDLKPYDVGAALVFLKVNSIPFSNYQGKRYNPFEDRGIIAGLSGVHPAMLKIIKNHFSFC